MKIFRLTCWSALALITLAGLASIPFMPTIEAAVQLPAGMLRSPVAVPRAHAYVPQKATATPPPLLAADTFQRADRVYWGKSSDGLMWGGDANSNSAFVIARQRGMILHGKGVYTAVLGPRSSDAEVVFSGSLASFLSNNLGAVLRWDDNNNWYKAYINGADLILARDVAGDIRTLKAVPFPASANATYNLRFRMQGTRLLASAWLTGRAEPRTWMVTASDAAIPAGFAGLRLIVQHGVAASIATFSEVAVLPPQH
jgi:hypothetical protein